MSFEILQESQGLSVRGLSQCESLRQKWSISARAPEWCQVAGQFGFHRMIIWTDYRTKGSSHCAAMSGNRVERSVRGSSRLDPL